MVVGAGLGGVSVGGAVSEVGVPSGAIREVGGNCGTGGEVSVGVFTCGGGGLGRALSSWRWAVSSHLWLHPRVIRFGGTWASDDAVGGVLGVVRRGGRVSVSGNHPGWMGGLLNGAGKSEGGGTCCQ